MTDFYLLEPCENWEKPGALLNASVGVCGLCGKKLTGMGGQNNMVCEPCGDLLKNGQLRGDFDLCE